MKVLENTPAVLSLGKLCDENGYPYEWINGQKPHLIKNGIRSDTLRHGELRSYCGSRLVKFVLRIFINFKDTFESHSASSSSTSSSSPTVKFRVKSEEIGLRVTSLQCKCQIQLMIDQGDLMIPKPIKPQKQIKRNPRWNGATSCFV